MEILKAILKMLGGLLFGAVLGLFLAGAGLALFTDTTPAEFIQKLRHTNFSEGLIAMLVGVASFAAFEVLLIFAHEAGHLVCGLLSGYKFVSFRLGNLTFIRRDGRLRVKKYSVAGTGGQCLLTPPEGDPESVPTVLYNAGGVLANILCLIAVLPFFFLDAHPLVKEALVIFIFADLILIVVNGIPMKIGGMGNDARNILDLRRSPAARRSFVNQLRANALIQNGTRPKDMPEEFFAVPDHIDYRNAFEVTLPVMYASRLTDLMDYPGALEAYEKLYARKDEIIPLYVREIACEMVFLYLLTDRPDKARALLDKDLRAYIDTYRRVMSSKERILCAMALHLDGDPAKAREIYETLRTRRTSYLLQGEVASDLALIQQMLEQAQSKKSPQPSVRI